MLVHTAAESCHIVPGPLPDRAMKEETDVQISKRSISQEGSPFKGPGTGGQVETQMSGDGTIFASLLL